jgi:serine/threonine protein kinase
VLVPIERTHDEVRAQWEQELNNLLSLRHPKITYVHDAFEYRDMFYLIIERCHGDLRSLFAIQGFDGEVWLPTLARDILQAVEFIHRFGYIHKDLHPGNVLTAYTRDRMVPSKAPVISFKVGDLGISRLESDVNIFHTRFRCKLSREGRLSPFSASPYAASTDSHTCGIMAPGLVISDVSNCPFLILFANSIPLNVTSAFPNGNYSHSQPAEQAAE